MKRILFACSLCLPLLFISSACHQSPVKSQTPAERTAQQTATLRQRSSGSAFLDKLAAAAVERTTHQVQYDPAYFVIDYPNGDVPEGKGVCTDEVIRAYRALGVDLQKEIHEDMKSNFSLYPKKWGMSAPDSNIDHRRVPNLMVFFSRKGAGLPITDNPQDYSPGDIIAWDLGGGQTHIGIVSNYLNADNTRLMIVHNIGAGPTLDDALFNWKIIGHYRYEKQG